MLLVLWIPELKSPSIRRTKGNSIPRSLTSLKPWSIIKGKAISLGTNCLKKMTKNSRLATFRICILPSTTISISFCSQACTLATHHLPLSLHNQCRRATDIQIRLTRGNSTPCTTTNRHHRNWNIKSINQTHIIVMQGGFWSSKCHFH